MAPGFEQQPDGALETESDLTGRFPCMFIVDEYPVRRLLLAKHDDLNLTRSSLAHRVCISPPQRRRPSRAASSSPGPRPGGAGRRLARGASGTLWQGVRQGVRGGSRVAWGGQIQAAGGKGRLIFLYSPA